MPMTEAEKTKAKQTIETFLIDPTSKEKQLKLMDTMEWLRRTVIENLEARNTEGGDDAAREAESILASLNLNYEAPILYKDANRIIEDLGSECMSLATNIELSEEMQQRNAGTGVMLVHLGSFVANKYPKPYTPGCSIS